MAARQRECGDRSERRLHGVDSVFEESDLIVAQRREIFGCVSFGGQIGGRPHQMVEYPEQVVAVRFHRLGIGQVVAEQGCLGHQFVETTVAPTCTESGYTVSKCTRCGEEEGERTNLVAPLGHEYKNGVCIRCGAPEPQENGGSSSAAPNYTVTGAETYETSVVDGRYIIAVPSEDAALNAVLGDLRAIKAQGADVVVFRTRSRESSLVIDEMLAMGPDATPFVLTHNGGEAQLTINGAAHNELIH